VLFIAFSVKVRAVHSVALIDFQGDKKSSTLQFLQSNELYLCGSGETFFPSPRRARPHFRELPALAADLNAIEKK
jgi:hypothetical protein